MFRKSSAYDKMITVHGKRFVPFGRHFSDVHPKGKNKDFNVSITFIFNSLLITLTTYIQNKLSLESVKPSRFPS